MEIDDQITRGNEIYASVISEFRYQNVEILEVSGQSTYYLNDASEASRDAIRTAAIANPGAFFWRNNAINVYITGASDSAITKFPPDNDIIILCQGIFDPTLAHEVGHSLNLLHTHQGGGADGCSDTLDDDSDWTSRDQMSQNAYGLNYSQLNATQKAAVDNTWGNLPAPYRQVVLSTTLSAAEFSDFGGCTDPIRKIKDGYAAKFSAAAAVILDPAVAVHTPEWLWLSTGIRAVDHAVEGICSVTPSPLVEAVSLHALRLLGRSLQRSKTDSADMQARLECLQGAWLSGFGILRVDGSGRLAHFKEKPAPERLDELESDLTGFGRRFLASMGIYLFGAPSESSLQLARPSGGPPTRGAAPPERIPRYL